MASLAVNSIAAGDGSVFIDVGGTWANIKSQTTGTNQSTGDPCNVYAGNLGGGANRSLSRIHLPFDTSSIGSGQTVTAATVRIVVPTMPDGGGTGSTYHIVQSTEANPNSLANADFSNIPGATSTMTSFGSQTINNTGTYTFTLNAAGIAAIQMSTYTKLALVEDHDLTNTDPGLASTNRIGVNMSDNATAGNRPLLTVTYSPTVGGGFIFGLI